MPESKYPFSDGCATLIEGVSTEIKITKEWQNSTEQMGGCEQGFFGSFTGNSLRSY